nr:MAG: hypothetical protein TU35_08430 [Thermoproteus sp. AZ2]
MDDDLEKYAWNIFRVGPKETLVAATPVKILRVKRVEGRVRTRFYVREDAIHECHGVINYMMEAPGGDINNLKPYCIPPRHDELEAVPRDAEWTGVALETEEGILEAIVPEYAAPRS